MINREKAENNSAKEVIGLLAWEYGLPSFSKNIGDIMNPQTFSFPLKIVRIKGANFETIVKRPNLKVLNSMIKAAQQLEKEGVRAITTSCGFNAIFQTELKNSVNIPVFTSSLIQVPLAHRMLKDHQKVGILTANANFLTEKHLREVGIDKSIPISIKGLENTKSFSKVASNPRANVSMTEMRKEVVGAVKELIKQDSNIGAIVLECTNLPPFAKAIQQEIALPVFDIVTLTNMVYQAVARKKTIMNI